MKGRQVSPLRYDGSVLRPAAVRNGMPQGRPYQYNGMGGAMSEAEVAGHLAAVRAAIVDEAQPDAPLSAPREWHAELAGDDAPTSALATSRAARDAALTPPKLITLPAAPDPDIPGGQVFGQPQQAALPAPARTAGVPAVHRTAFYARPPALDARLAALRPAPARPARRCRTCGYLRTKCACRRA